jgi:hypothetical protein
MIKGISVLFDLEGKKLSVGMWLNVETFLIAETIKATLE